MNNFILNSKAAINKYKYLLIPLLPLAFFLGLLFFIPTTQNGQKEQAPAEQNPTPVPNKSTATITNRPPTPFPTIKSQEAIEEEDLNTRPGLITKETLQNGTTKYIFKSPDEKRPKIYITHNEHEILFEREIILPQYPVKITDYTKPYGAPERTITGSIYYGSDAQTLIYASEGIAIVGNPQRNIVYEQHLFEPMTIREYIEKYGDDIPIDRR